MQTNKKHRKSLEIIENHCKPIKKVGKSLKINKKQSSKNPISCPGMKKLTGIGRWNDFHMFREGGRNPIFRMKNDKIIGNQYKSLQNHAKS